MPSEITNAVHRTIRFSRSMPLSWVVALGASVSVGFGVYVVIGQLAQIVRFEHMLAPYLILAALALPIVLTYAERAAVLPGSSGPYNLAQNNNVLWMTFGTAWLLLGGYATLVALLAWGVALHIDLLAGYFFNLSLNQTLMATAIIGLLILANQVGKSWSWRRRSQYIYAALAFLAFTIVRDLIAPVTSSQSISVFGSGLSSIPAAAVMLSSILWGLFFILNVRDEIKRPTQTLFTAMLLTVLLGCGFGWLAAMAIDRFHILSQTFVPLLEVTSGFSLIPESVLVIAYATMGLLICFIVLNRSLINGLQLMGDMVRDGFLPERLQLRSRGFIVPMVPFILFGLLGIVAINAVSILTLIGLAAFSFMWITALVHLPDAFRTSPKLPPARRPKLPFHPLFPWLVSATGVFIPFIYLDDKVWLGGGLWIGLGSLFYYLYARQHSLAIRRQTVLVGDAPAPDAAPEARYQVLIGLTDEGSIADLLQAGARIAQSRQGSLVVLDVLVMPEQIPIHLKHKEAQRRLDGLAAVVEQHASADVPVRPLVRLASDRATGILETIKEEQVDLALLGWTGGLTEPDLASTDFLNSIIKAAECDVAVLHGHLPPACNKVLAVTAGGPHAPMGLALGQALVRPDQGQLQVKTMVRGMLTPERRDRAQDRLQSTLAGSRDDGPIENKIAVVDDLKTGILEAAQEVDLLLMGISKQGFLEQSFFGGLPVQVAAASLKPTILTRVQEVGRQVWLQRLWEGLTGPLPNLTAARQTDVYQQMREAAQPSVDFFVLIGLAAAIAGLGLLQNSAAVIIGAMLVAPLMSPILAMAMSIIRADIKLLLTAAEATTQGILMAIIVGMVVTLISPITTPTNEILARTTPNILDLMVALASGAAAGYAISRKEVAAALPGVAIAAALVPPLCVVGYGIGTAQLGVSGGALLLFTTNLIAITFSAGLIFLALGFYPSRSERGEVMRGLQITITLLVVIFIILGFATASIVIQLNRQSRVEAIFKQEIEDRGFGVTGDLSIARQGEGFVIEALFLSYEDKVMAPADIDDLERKLSEAINGPVTVRGSALAGTRYDTQGLSERRQLEIEFEEKVVEHGGAVERVLVEQVGQGFKITAIVIAVGDDDLAQAKIAEIQQELTEEMKAAVAIDSTIINGDRYELEPPPTPSPTITPTPAP